MRAPTDKELRGDSKLEHVHFTSDFDWDPSILDCEPEYDEDIDPHDPEMICEFHELEVMSLEEA